MLALAGLAYAAYQQELLTTASDHAEQLWKTLQESPILAEQVDLKVYWMLGMVWQGLGDNRTDMLWNKASTLLKERSENIPDETARQMFLHTVPTHQAILRSS